MCIILENLRTWDRRNKNKAQVIGVQAVAKLTAPYFLLFTSDASIQTFCVT
jgi:hypothetical protein